MKADPQGGERLDPGRVGVRDDQGTGRGGQEGGAAGAGQQIRPPSGSGVCRHR